ncbi:radical SAM protein [Nitrosopumilus sp.]|nr:radical SAM protein [Nitrosopumilus sp.]
MNKEIRKTGSKKFYVHEGLTIDQKRELEKWGQYDDDWSFHLYDIPEEFRTQKKYDNFILAKKEEHSQELVLKSKPYHIEIEPTNICNLHCPLCSTGIQAKTRTKGIMEFKHFKNLIDKIKDTTLQLALQNWGEPTLAKDIPKMIRYAADAGIFTHMSSNFSTKMSDNYLNDLITSGLGRLVTDVDGTSQEIYELYRQGGSLELVLDNIKKAVTIKKQHNLKFPLIQAKMLVTKKNEHQIEEFKKIAKELEVDEIEIGNIQLDPNSASEEWLPENDKYVYSTYRGEERTTQCHWPWSGMVINWEGGVAPCAIVDDPGSDFGNVLTDGIWNVWNNDFYASARSTWKKGSNGNKTTICNICQNNTHNIRLLRVGSSFSLTMNKNVEFVK